jgi:hypothetical protein
MVWGARKKATTEQVVLEGDTVLAHLVLQRTVLGKERYVREKT